MKKIVLEYTWHFEYDDFYKLLNYFTELKYEIHLILIGIIKYDFSNIFDPKIFNGPFFGPYGKWFDLIDKVNIIYEYSYVDGYKKLYEKLELPLDRFKQNRQEICEFRDKLKIFGYLNYDQIKNIYTTRFTKNSDPRPTPKIKEKP